MLILNIDQKNCETIDSNHFCYDNNSTIAPEQLKRTNETISGGLENRVEPINKKKILNGQKSSFPKHDEPANKQPNKTSKVFEKSKRKLNNEHLVLKTEIDNFDDRIPNGGYGWVVVFASFMCNLTVDGICYTFGIFLPYFLQHFQSNEAITALTGSLLSGCYMTVGVFVSGLVNSFGCRSVTIVGSVIASLSFALATQAPNVYVLIVTYGIITGCSFGLIYLPSIVSVGNYFTSKRAFATGIAVCGSGMGAFLFSPLCQWLLTMFHWQQALLILSGCILACSIYGCLMRPLVVVEKKCPQIIEIDIKRKEKKPFPIKIISGNSLGLDHDPTLPPKSPSKLSQKSSHSIRSINSVHSNRSRRSMRPRTWTITSQLTELEASTAIPKQRDSKFLANFSVLKIPAMALLSVSNVFGMTGYYIPYVYITRFAHEVLKVETTKAAFVLSSIGISNVVGRLVFGLVCDRFGGSRVFANRIHITALLVNNLCMLAAGLSVVAIPFCSNYWMLLGVCILFGFTISSYMSLTSIILVDLMTLDLLPTTFGLISCFRGISSIAGPPLAGLLYELTDSFDGVFIVAGCLICLASLISFTIHHYEKEDIH